MSKNEQKTLIETFKSSLLGWRPRQPVEFA